MMPWDAARASHPDAPLCQRRSRDYRGVWYLDCGYPLDPALGPVEVHPWCEAAQAPPQERQRHVPQRARELAIVRAAERRRMAR